MGAQHLRVPYGLIRGLCYPGGVRLSPRVSRERPPEPTGDAVHYYKPTISTSTTPRVVNPTFVPNTVVHTIEQANHLQGLSIMGNLSNEAYRFFKGSSIMSSDYFQCRGCGAEEYVRARKLVHMKECRQLIEVITKLLRRDKICVVCNTQTQKERWTVPLCCEGCVNKWRFTMPGPWLDAKRLVLSQDPSLLRHHAQV